MPQVDLTHKLPDLPCRRTRLKEVNIKMSNRLTIKGQVTIPKNVRDFLGLTMGSSAVEFYIDADGSVKACSRQETARVSHCDRVLAMLSGNYV